MIDIKLTAIDPQGRRQTMDGFLRQRDGGEEFLQEGRNGRSVPCAVHLAEIFTIPGKDYKRAGGSKSKVYSITKHAEETAIRLATEWRKNMELALARNNEA